MPAIKVSNEDFEAVAGAALEAESIGDVDEARTLDRLARKIETALSGDDQQASAKRRLFMQPDGASSV